MLVACIPLVGAAAAYQLDWLLLRRLFGMRPLAFIQVNPCGGLRALIRSTLL
jgi:hypothetical protein